MATVLIVDDHPLVRHALRQVVAEEPQWRVCGEAASPDDARVLIQQHSPDLVLLDLCYGGSRMEGLRFVEEICEMSPQTAVLVSSMQDETIFAERAIEAGAAGYVSKGESVQTVAAAIREVLGGRKYLSERAVEAIENPRNDANRMNRLSPRELQVFELVGQGFSPQQIADKLEIGLKTVDAHRQNIRSKLGLANMGDLIRQAAVWTAELT